MSKNDVIYLVKVKRHYTIIHADIEREQPYSKVIAKTPLEALEKAQEMQDEVEPEYGVIIDIKEEI